MPKSLTVSADGAREILLDKFRVIKLTQDVADLKAIIFAKDTTIRRLNESVRALAIKPPDPTQKQPDKPPGASARPIGKTSAGPNTKVSINWPKVENWGWRGLFAYIAFEAIRSALK